MPRLRKNALAKAFSKTKEKAEGGEMGGRVLAGVTIRDGDRVALGFYSGGSFTRVIRDVE